MTPPKELHELLEASSRVRSTPIQAAATARWPCNAGISEITLHAPEIGMRRSKTEQRNNHNLTLENKKTHKCDSGFRWMLQVALCDCDKARQRQCENESEKAPPTTAASLQAWRFSSPVRKRNALPANCERGDSAEFPCLLRCVLLMLYRVTSHHAPGSGVARDPHGGQLEAHLAICDGAYRKPSP